MTNPTPPTTIALRVMAISAVLSVREDLATSNEPYLAARYVLWPNDMLSDDEWAEVAEAIG